MKGIIKIKNLPKKFIVVSGDDGLEYFVSTNSLRENVSVGDRVDFDINPDDTKGLKGKNLKKDY